MADDVDRLAELVVAEVHAAQPLVGPHQYGQLTAAVASLLRARLPRWVEVTDDPATWPDDGYSADAPSCVIWEHWNGATGLGSRRKLRNAIRRAAPGAIIRWMPWPASPAKGAT